MARSTDEKEKNYTVFGEETEFSGVLTFTDNLEIAGKFEGSIKATGNLEFASTCVCKADTITANSIVLEGTVSGNMHAERSIEMHSGSKISGNVVTTRLRIDDGVDFSGQVTMLDASPDLDIFTYSPTELKEAVTKAEKERDTVSNT